MSDERLRALEREALACPCEEHHQRWVEELRRTAGPDPFRIGGVDVLRGPQEVDSPRPWLEPGHRLEFDPWGKQPPMADILRENARVRREGSGRRTACTPCYGETVATGRARTRRYTVKLPGRENVLVIRWIQAAVARLRANRRDTYVRQRTA